MTRWLAAIAAILAVAIGWVLLTDGPPAAGTSPPDAGAHSEPAPPAADPLRASEGHETPDAPAASDGAARGPASPPESLTLFHGRVLASDGKPVPWRTSFWMVREGARRVRVSVAEDGHFARAGLLPGTYQAVIKTYEHEVIAARVEIPPGVARVERSFVLPKMVVIPVRLLTPDGKPLLEAVQGSGKKPDWLAQSMTLVATRTRPPRRLPQTVQSAHRYFGIGEYEPQLTYGDAERNDGRHGTLIVEDRFPLWVGVCLRSETIHEQELTEAPKRLDLVVDPQAVRRLFAGVTFRLTCEGDASQLENPTFTLQDRGTQQLVHDTFEQDGDRFTIRDHPPGRQQLGVWVGEDLEPWLRNVDLQPGEILDLGVIHLRRMVRAPLVLRDTAGHPLVGVMIWPHRSDVAWELQRTRPLAHRTDAEGKTTLELGPHPYTLRVAGPGAAYRVVEVDLRGDMTDALELELPPTTPVNFSLGKVAFPAEVHVVDARGRVVKALVFSRPSVWAFELEAGAYELRLLPYGEDARRQSFTVGEVTGPVVAVE